MTTTVKIEAHCASSKEVKVDISDDAGGFAETRTLQDGEKLEVYAYDARRITVYEREK